MRAYDSEAGRLHCLGGPHRAGAASGGWGEEEEGEADCGSFVAAAEGGCGCGCLLVFVCGRCRCAAHEWVCVRLDGDEANHCLRLVEEH